MIYSNDDIRELYLNINETVKQKPQASLEELSKELNARIDLKQKFHNGCVLGDLLLALAIEKSNLDFIKFLFKNELKIISIISQQEETCHIPKTINGQSILNYAVHFGNTEILDLLLQNVNAEQSKLIPKSKLYKLCQQLKSNALDKAIDKNNEKLVTLLVSAIEEKQEKQKISNEEIKVGSGSNSNATSKSIATSTKKTNPTTVPNSGNGRSVINKPVSPVVSTNAGTSAMSSGNDKSSNIRTHGDGLSNHTITPNSGNGQHHNNKNETPVVTVPSILTKKTNTNQTVTPNSGNGQHHNNENKTPVVTGIDQTATPNNDNKANGFVDAQFSMPNEQETKYKESKKDFYTSLTKDVVGVVITGLFITAAVMVPFVAGAVVCSVIAALIAIYTGLHVKNSTLPSYREMRENEVERVTGCHPSAQTLGSKRP
ncbi:ankyrin repeat domain-containing protein [Wolbachia endosymbiont (group A) of Acrocera orbiculus]|uniref:ankyrin repeat domain-containing protein n=1 Tax=Wolbachia endosymbiont (group A) of Acrocera orbiculus TaxID=2953971 RepID=UPI0022266AD9|nr:ankyrin repeat domain-containing protein [Wolbachia endosymbiont (group A) of Acrocera orbiculus]